MGFRVPGQWLFLVWALCWAASTFAQQPEAPSAAASTLVLNKREIVTLRGTLLGRPPAERVAAGLATLHNVLQQGGPGHVTVWLEGGTAGLQVDGNIVFYLLPTDLDPAAPTPLPTAAEAVRSRLQRAVQEHHEMSDPRRIAEGLGLALLATVLVVVAIRLCIQLRRAAQARLRVSLLHWQQGPAAQGLAGTTAAHAQTALHGLVRALSVTLVLLLLDLWASFVLRQFAYTRPWGERSQAWLLDLLLQFLLSAAAAVPGILTAVLIFFIARLASRAMTAFMARAERGEVVVGWLDADTAGPTRRVGNFVIWLFALALAYPFLPGANSEAFKGVSVLAGLMLSLGASGVVGQVVSGLSLMYSRTLRPGEYVKIGDTEGTVTTVGLFATKLNTGLGEEVSLPNAVVFSQPVRNFSRLVQDGQFVLHAAVTIGYTTPWRQVHAMLLEAARRTPGVAASPVPYVVQTALSDFYVEYRLCAQADRSAPRRRADAMSQLNANIQDVFNENGVQIMSPHYRGDPAEPQVVPPAQWNPALAPTAKPPGD